MRHPFTADPDTLFSQFLQGLPQDYEQMAYEFEAFARPRKIKTPLQLMRLVLLYCALDQTLREVAATHIALYEVDLTDEAVRKRLLACRPWLKAILAKMFPTPPKSELRPGRLLLTDGSTIQGPASTGVDWRLHITIDLLQLDVVNLEITGPKVGEHLNKSASLPGDILLADRGYFRTKQLHELSTQNVDLLVRMSPQLVVLKTPQLEKLDLINELKAHPHRRIRSFEVFVGEVKSEKGVSGWVHARRIPKTMAEKQRRKLRKRRQKSGRTPKKESLYLCGWLLLFTTLPPDTWEAGQLFELYACRWQVELAIKRLKSILDLSEIRCQKDSPLGELWLLGKLVYYLLLVKRMNLPEEWLIPNEDRVGTLWRPLKWAKLSVDPMISGSLFWKEGARSRALEVLRERKRKRRLQTIPSGVVTSLPSSDSPKMELNML